MLKIEAPTLEEAYAKASSELSCSITDLEVTIVQNPSKGLFGLFKKSAILVVSCKTQKCEQNSTIIKQEEQKTEDSTNKDTIKNLCKEIEKTLADIFSQSCYKISSISVYPHDEQTITVEFNGDDSALLIGKEGHRYRALSYLLFNWIHAKYNYYVRLEVADFLKNQETALKHYLDDIVSNVKTYGKAQTKPLDSVLAPIALKELRAIFPNKYVALKSEYDGAKSIIIDEFWGKQTN